jgi:hypothetical protein
MRYETESVKLGLSLFLWVQLITDVTKYISGCMASLSAMIQLELAHVNILSKMDLLVISWVDKYWNCSLELNLISLLDHS